MKRSQSQVEVVVGSGNYPVLLSTVKVRGVELSILRDDRLEGGTKSRALVPYLEELKENGFRGFGYASPFSGYAQLALSHACRELNLTAHIFAEADPRYSEIDLKEYTVTSQARFVGAKTYLFPTLAEAETACKAWQIESPSHLKIPLGLDCDGYRAHLNRSLREVWGQIVEQWGGAPRRIWISLGSGTLSKELRKILPESVELCCINVHVLNSKDSRITHIRSLSGTHYYEATQPFSSACDDSPPVPSNVYYDAKVWGFLKKYIRPGDLWWNVAR